MIRYELRFIRNISKRAIEEYFEEFDSNGEYCAVLWRLYEIPIDEWLTEVMADTRNFYVGFYVNETLVGIGRVSPNPNYPANGRLGYGIRPSKRGRAYATVMLRLMEDYCKFIGMDYITACVDVRNERSINALVKAGYEHTGVTYDWFDNRKAYEMALHINA